MSGKRFAAKVKQMSWAYERLHWPLAFFTFAFLKKKKHRKATTTYLAFCVFLEAQLDSNALRKMSTLYQNEDANDDVVSCCSDEFQRMRVERKHTI